MYSRKAPKIELMHVDYERGGRKTRQTELQGACAVNRLCSALTIGAAPNPIGREIVNIQSGRDFPGATQVLTPH